MMAARAGIYLRLQPRLTPCATGTMSIGEPLHGVLGYVGVCRFWWYSWMLHGFSADSDHLPGSEVWPAASQPSMLRDAPGH